MAAFTYVALRDYGSLRRIALSSDPVVTRANETLGACQANSSFDARRILRGQHPGCYVIPEAYIGEVLAEVWI